MATITLTANTNVSALTLANGDTIDLAGFQLNFDVQPSVTGIQVTTPGTAGTCVFPVACVIPTWDFFAGAGTLINTLPANCEIGKVTGGNSANRFGVNTNNGFIAESIGGSATSAHGTNSNNGTIQTARASATNNAHGVSLNAGQVGNAIAGAIFGAVGVLTNNSTVDLATGGSNSFAYGVSNNNGTVLDAVGGTNVTANGVSINNGLVLRLADNSATAVASWRGSRCFVEGPFVAGIVPNNIKTIYSLGTLSGSATIAVDADVITLSEGGGGGGSAGFTGIRKRG